MKRIFAIILLIAIMTACSSKKEKQSENGDSVEATDLSLADKDILSKAKVTIYYFHGKQRCKTCVSIQALAEEVYTKDFSDNKDVQFVEIDISKRENDNIAEKYEISWSSLILATANSRVNITDEAFTYVLSDSDLLKSIIIKEVNSLLNN